jgi:hypothetical protein
MAKAFAFFLAAFFVFSGCSKKTGDSGGGFVPLPDLGISLQVPRGMETVPEKLQELQEAAAGFPPVPPFADFPVYYAANTVTRTALLVSRMDFADPGAGQLDPAAVMEQYRKNLEAYYQTDAITANETVQGDFRLMIMRFLYEPGEEPLYLTKVLYHRYPQRYFMIDLFITGDSPLNQEETQQLDQMFLSIQTINQP